MIARSAGRRLGLESGSGSELAGVATLAGGVERLPLVVLVAFHARDAFVVLVKRPTGHGVVVKTQIGRFPTDGGVAAETIAAQRPFVRIGGLVAHGALVGGGRLEPEARNHRGLVAVFARDDEMFADEFVALRREVLDVRERRLGLAPTSGVVARNAKRAEGGLGMLIGPFDFVTIRAAHGQFLELRLPELGVGRRGLVALDAPCLRMFAGERELGIAVVVELFLRHVPCRW